MLVVLVCPGPQGRLSLGYKKTITTTGSACQLDEHTQGEPSPDRGMHTPLCSHVHTNTSSSVSVQTVHPLMHIPNGVHAHSKSLLPALVHLDELLHLKDNTGLHPPEDVESPCQSFDRPLAEEVNPHPAGRRSARSRPHYLSASPVIHPPGRRSFCASRTFK